MGRIISTESLDIEEQKSEYNLRPQYLSEYIGQKKVKDNLHIFIEAAKKRNEPLDHLLLYGPPGLGKTTLSTIVANEMGVNIKITSGPAIEKPGELAAILNNLSDNDILFIDEIHRLSTQVEEVLYPAMEDYAIDVVIGKGAGARSIRLDLPRFTLIGATTRVGMLSAPLRDRFGMVDKLEFYTHDDLREIVMRSAEVLGVDIDEEGALEIARRSRGTPRLANRLLKRCRDYAEVCHDGHIDHDVAKAALDKLQVDSMGLDVNDRNILMTMIEKFAGGPVGLDTLAAAVGEDPGTIEDVYEPYFIMNGFINRTPRGRVVTDLCYRHFGLDAFIRISKGEWDMAQKNDIKVVINNKVYTLSGQESEDYLQNVATYINGKIAECQSSEAYRRFNAEYQNVLLALNIADDYFKAKDQVNQMLTEDDDKDKQIYDLRHEVIEVQIKYESAQKMIEEYKEKISELQRQIIKLEAEKNVK